MQANRDEKYLTRVGHFPHIKPNEKFLTQVKHPKQSQTLN